MSTETPDPIEDLPPFVSIKRTSELLGLSRATIWRRIADGSLEIASGSGKGRKRLVLKTSIERFTQPAPVKP
jgi:hypothetical protein